MQELTPQTVRPCIVRINDAFIEKWHPKYDKIEDDEPEYQAILEVVAKEVSEIRTISEPTFRRILDWKAARVKGSVEWNAYDTYRDSFRHCLLAPDNRKLAILVELPGIGAPVGSTILHFMYPKRLPIIDKRTVEVLHYAGHLKSKQRNETSYAAFRAAIFGIAQQCPRWSLREIDRALFAYHKIEFEPCLKNASICTA